MSLVGGHPALDFLNTVKYRGQVDPQDRLETVADVVEWSRVAGLLSDAEAGKLSRPSRCSAVTDRLLREICDFREEVRLLFETSRISGKRFRQAASHVENVIRAFRPVASISSETGGLTWRVPVRTVDHVKDRIVESVIELLSHRSDLNIKTCCGDDCDWLFIDRSRPGRRQWCDTRVCGNIARVRRFREKRRAG